MFVSPQRMKTPLWKTHTHTHISTTVVKSTIHTHKIHTHMYLYLHWLSVQSPIVSAVANLRFRSTHRQLRFRSFRSILIGGDCFVLSILRLITHNLFINLFNLIFGGSVMNFVVLWNSSEVLWMRMGLQSSGEFHKFTGRLIYLLNLQSLR